MFNAQTIYIRFYEIMDDAFYIILLIFLFLLAISQFSNEFICYKNFHAFNVSCIVFIISLAVCGYSTLILIAENL